MSDPQPPFQREWRSARALQDVRDLNEHFLGVIGRLAVDSTDEPVLGSSRDSWRDFDSAARKRAAQSPVLLMDLYFQDEHWWRAAAVSTAPIHVASGQVPAKDAADLTRAALMLAWSVAREDRGSTAVLFGMTHEVASLVRSLGPQQIDRIASRYSHELRPRWDNRPDYWISLLSAAQSGNGDALREVHFYGLQLLGAELLRQ